MSERRVLPLTAFLALLCPTLTPAAAPPAGHDRHGYPLPPGAVARLGRVRFYHGTSISALAFSPDGSTLATGGEHMAPRFWSVSSGSRLPGRLGQYGALALTYSPDGKLLAWGGSGGVLGLWDVKAGKVVRHFPRHQSFVRAVAFSPDGRWLASTAGDGTVRLWSTATGREVLRVGVHARSLAFSPDGRSLAFAVEDHVRLLELASGLERRRLTGHQEEVFCLAFSPDGRLLATGSRDTTILVWGVRGPPRARPADLPRSWAVLAGQDATAALNAIQALAADPERAVPFLRQRLRPAAVDPRRVARLIDELGSDEFAVRLAAERGLGALGQDAAPAIVAALAKRPPLDERLRLERLLERAEKGGLVPERLREVRAVEALEYAGTAAARRLLEVLAGETPTARLTAEAKAALGRLGAPAAAGGGVQSSRRGGDRSRSPRRRAGDAGQLDERAGQGAERARPRAASAGPLDERNPGAAAVFRGRSAAGDVRRRRGDVHPRRGRG